STFTAVLPLAVQAGSPATIAAPAGPRPASLASTASVGVMPSGVAHQVGDVESLRLDGVRVMVVDDEPDTREVVAHILRRAGALVTTAASTAETLEQLPS